MQKQLTGTLFVIFCLVALGFGQGAQKAQYTLMVLSHQNHMLYDMDMDSMSLVKALPDGRHGTTYPDMTWEPKEAFAAVANHFGSDHGAPAPVS